MKNPGVVLTSILMFLLLLNALIASAATDGFYQLSQSSQYSWDGTDGSRLKAITADYAFTYGDEASVAYAMPWTFTFYGQTYNQITADTNGNIWFGPTDSAHSFNLANNGRGPVIAAWNNDLSSYYYGGVFIQHKTNPERVVIEWQTETYTTEGLQKPNYFEVVLFPNGNIAIDYKAFTSDVSNKDFGSGVSRNDGSNSVNLTNDRGNVFTLAGHSFLFVPDTTPPVGTSFTVPTTSSTLSVAVSTFTATDNIGVTGYLITESSTPPLSTATDWSATAPTSYTAASAGSHTLYPWIKDAAGNVSAVFATPRIVVITLPDTTVPTITGFTVPATSTTLAVAVSTFTATDNIGVTGYLITESSTAPLATAAGWTATAPTSYTAATAGSHTLYPWTKDAAGNVSAAFATPRIVAITIGNMALALSTNYITADYQGNLGITVSNISPMGSEVFIEQFVDANRNGMIDASDYVIRSFKVSDGVVSGNSNVQGDGDGAANSAISTTLNYFMQNDLYHAPGQYIFRASKETQIASAILTVSPVLQPQTISGTVTDGTNLVPGAMVRLLDKWRRHLAFAVADEYGNYSLEPKNAGQFYVIPYAYGYAARNDIPLTTVTSGQTISGHNIALLKGDNHLFGRLTNTEGSSGIDGLWVVGRSSNYTGIAISDFNGSYDLSLPAGQYSITASLDLVSPNPSTKGYFSIQRGVDGVTLPGYISQVEFKLPLPDVFVTGKITDPAGNRLGGVPIVGKLQSYDFNGRTSESNEPRGGALSDSNGNYTLGLRHGDTWGMGISLDYDLYIGAFKHPFSTLTSPLTGNDFIAQKVTSWIEGSLKNRSDFPIKDADIKLQGVINGINSWISTPKTASDGTFRFGVFAGNWDVEFLSSPDVIIYALRQSVDIADGESKSLNAVVDSRLPFVMINPLRSPTNKVMETLSGVRGEGVGVFGGNQYFQLVVDYPTSTTWSGSLEMGAQEGNSRITVVGQGANGIADIIVRDLQIDRSRPVVTIVSPAANLAYPSAPILQFSVSDQNPVTVVVRIDGKVVQNHSGGNLNLTAGNHSVLVEATDIAGNIGFSSIGFTVGAPPLQSNVTENFESGDFSKLPWVLSGDGMWSVLAGSGYNYTEGAVTPASLRDGESAVLELTYTCVTSGSIKFKYGLDSPNGYTSQPFEFSIDGVSKLSTGGYIALSSVNYSITPGIHKFKWSYSKQDSNTFTGNNAAWLDEIFFGCNITKKTR
ncbi:MAG: hypothetical protein A2X80_07740 [Geobacteraceae bacterium GWB2_52_12]|nr:MAG: hypothetical protein A2X80_07740 [Geobacteraceae bacterium GWB2_52_12]